MKLIFFTSLLCLLSATNNQEPPSKLATVKIPTSIDKSTNKQILSFAKGNFKRPALVWEMKNIYKTGNIIFGFEDYEQNNNVDLDIIKERTEGEVEEIRSAGTNDKVQIIAYNGRKFLIHKRNKGDEYFYNFISEQKQGKGIKGGIQFKASDYEKGNLVLKNMLQGIIFK
jgi:hypothetical protein